MLYNWAIEHPESVAGVAGIFPQESIEQLKEIGKWMDINGESVYGTTKWLVSQEGPTSLSMKGSGEREKNGFQTDFTPEDF